MKIKEIEKWSNWAIGGALIVLLIARLLGFVAGELFSPLIQLLMGVSLLRMAWFENKKSQAFENRIILYTGVGLVAIGQAFFNLFL